VGNLLVQDIMHSTVTVVCT